MTQDAPPAIDASPIVAAPEGWRTVPFEPTRQMIVAAEDELENQTDSDYDSDADGNRFPYSIRRPGWERAVYQAMLAAAPPVPEGKAEPVAWRAFDEGMGGWVVYGVEPTGRGYTRLEPLFTAPGSKP